jgi:LPXTG-motif cell wall-anchored protein
MTKTNKRRRVASVLLALVMLLSLMPSLELPAHAFWEDYDQGTDCIYCDHYHWGENMCDGCGFCTVDCNSDCFAEFHCNDCGECLFNTTYWCDQCYKCADCMEETHCSTCGKCYIGEDDQLCGECYKGPCCSITICDSCGFCDDCANDDSDPMHCSLCNSCFGSVDECVDDDDTGVIHCIDCHTSCEQCEECLLNQESCEDCGLCLECCRDNSEGGGCPDGETCVESAEWDEHICQGCDGWVTDKEDEDEFCETCELCKECCEGNSDCSEGMCAMDTDYADHFCEDCGLCFHDSDPCEDGCDQRCKDCCRDAVSAMGCDHDDWCFSDSDFEDHLKTEHSGAGHTHIASATWAADGTQHWHPCRYCDDKKLNATNHEFDVNGVCKVCGYISGSSIVINRQPRGVKCKTSIYDDYNEEPENGLLFYENNPVTFSVSAKSLKGDELTYQWYRKNNENPTVAPYKLPEGRFYTGVTTSTLKMPVSTQACQEDYSYYCVIGRKGDPSDTMKTAEAKLTATHAYSHKQAGVRVPTEDSERTPKYNVTWVDKHGVTHDGVVGGDPKCDGHKLPCLFEAGEYEAHYMTTGSKERIFPHTFVLDRSLDAVGGGRVDVLRCSVCDYTVTIKSHVHDYGWNWDCTGFGSIYEYTFNIGGSTKTVEQLILESDYAHPEKCKVPGCEEFIMVPHSWGRWNVVKNPDTEGGRGGMEAECSICEYTKTKIDKDNDEGTDHWTKDTALVTVKNGRATRMIVKPGDKIRLYPEERTGQKAIGWKVEYRREYNEYDIILVTRNWNTNEAKTLFKLVTNGSALEWGCTIPEFSAMGAPGGGSFFFEPVYAGCDHSGGTTVLNAKEQVCDRKGYTGDTACADCGHVISAGSDIYPPANAGHSGSLQPLYYYGTANSATTDASHGGKRYNAKSGDCRHRAYEGDCRHRAYEGDYRCTACGGTVKGEIGDFRHSGPLELRDVRTATCTERGYSGNQYCTSCDRIAQKGVSTPSLHEIADNYKLINEVKPGCTTSGYSGDQQCTAGCGQIIRYGHVVNKLSHDWDGGKPAKQGKSEGILYTCQRADCGETRFVRSSAATKFTVTVIKGTASIAAGIPITDKIAQNTVVTVTANAPEAGKVFDKWVVLEGNVTLADVTKATTTFTMPGNDVKLEATYKDAPPSHTHSYGTEWKYDGTNHWHECECGDKADTAAHSFQWVIDNAATKEATGIKHEKCTVCGAKRSENTVIDKLPDGGNTDNTGSSDNNTNKPGNDDSTKCPQTGDSSNHIGWLAALCGVLTLLGVSGKKRKKSEVK